MTAQSVFIKNMLLEASIGIHAHEKKAPQPIRVSAEVEVEDFPHDLKDNIANVLSYSDIHKLIRTHVAARHFELVETLAEVIAADILALPHAICTTVTVEKLQVYENTESVGVTITRPSK